MEVTSELVGNVHVVAVYGDLDASNIQNFRAIVLPMLSSPIKLLIDLTHVPFIDSSGMGALISCHRAAAASGGKVSVCCLAGQVRSAFELIRLNLVIDICESRQAALKKLSEGAGA